MKISELAITNYQFTVIMLLLLIISGVVSLVTMPRSEDPQVAPHGTTVLAFYPGASPADVEQLILDPIEEKINEMVDIKRIDSWSRDSLGVIDVEFQTGVDMDDKYSKLVQKINSIRTLLPREITDLQINRWNMSDYVIIQQIALISETDDFSVLDEEADRLKDMLEKVMGVKKVKKLAIPEREVRISLDLGKMAQKNISITQVIGAVKMSNYNIPGGNIDIGEKRFNIKTSGSYESIGEIKDTIVHAHREKVVFLKDIADVRFDYEDNLYFARVNGQRAVFVTVNQKEGTNIFDVVEDVDRVLVDFEKKLPSSISVYKVFDQSEGVADRLNRFFNNLFLGLILVGLVILLSLGLRASYIVIMVIPFSILISLGFVDLTGYGLQQMVIAGLVIALGLLVDNAIVVTENISRFMRMGKPPVQAAVEGTRQIGWAVISSTVTTVFAFGPIALMGESSGEYIRSMPVTVIYTLIASLFIALTFTPFLSSRFLRVRIEQKDPPFQKLLWTFIEKSYRPALNLALSRPVILLLLVFFVFGMSLYSFRYVGVSLFPKAEKPQLLINVKTPEGTNIYKTDEVAGYVESVLEKRTEVKKYAANVGRGNPVFHYSVESEEMDVSHAQFFVELNNYNWRIAEQLVSELREEFSGYPGARIEVKEIEQGPPVVAPIAIRILGEDLDILTQVSRDVEDIFLATPGTVNVSNPQKFSKTDLHIKVNRAKAGMLGIPMVEIDRTIRASIAGLPVSQYRDKEGKEYDIIVRLPFKGRHQPEDFNRIYVPSMSGAIIPLRQIANVTFKTVPRQINHYNFDRAATITSDVKRGYSTDKVTKKIIEELEKYNWPTGYTFSVSGEMESQEESFGGMGKAIIIALIAIFAVLVLQFKSFSQPLIVFTAIPLAVMGSITALLITGYTFSFTAFIGLTSLVGIVVNNSIILVDYTNKLRSSGKSVMESLKEAGETRFIPIVLTSATTIGGLLPLTLRGGSLWGPMGWTLIGGLMVSTFLTLVVVPVLYRLISRDQQAP